MWPDIKFTQSGDVTIAYQVLGEGPRDLLLVPGFVSHLEAAWEYPSYARFLRQLSSFSRLIQFDKRGTGLSDRLTDIPTLAERADDVRAVMDAAGSKKAALFGVSEGAPLSLMFAASYPERVSALILYGAVAKILWAPDYPAGFSANKERVEEWLAGWRKNWGGPQQLDEWAPSMAHDEHFRQWWARFLRLSASPNSIITLFRMNHAIDVRYILPTISVPTLVLHRAGDRAVCIEHGRHIAEHIDGAKFVELPGADHLWWVGDTDAIVDQIQEFLTGQRPQVEATDRVLATVLFTDIVDSTKHAHEWGDRRWREVLNNHNSLMQLQIDRFNGRLVKNTGDGVLATFDGPARAINCACNAARDVRRLGLEIRAGVHTGEVELISNDVSGIAVNTAARVLQRARPNEVWASRTVKDLVAGSRFRFEEKGEYSLKGIEGHWSLYSVEA